MLNVDYIIIIDLVACNGNYFIQLNSNNNISNPDNLRDTGLCVLEVLNGWFRKYKCRSYK